MLYEESPQIRNLIEKAILDEDDMDDLDQLDLEDRIEVLLENCEYKHRKNKNP